MAKRMTPQEILNLVADRNNINAQTIRGKRRRKGLTVARIQAAQMLVDAGYTLAEAGQAMGGRMPSTIRYLLGRHRKQPKSWSPVRDRILGGLGTDE